LGIYLQAPGVGERGLAGQQPVINEGDAILKNKAKKKAAHTRKGGAQHEKVYRAAVLVAFLIPLILTVVLSIIERALIQDHTQENLTKFFATEFSRQLETAVRHLSSIAPAMASSENVLGAIKQNDTTSLKNIEALLTQSQAGIKSVRLIPANGLIKHSIITPPLSFAQRDTLRRIERGDALYLELSQKDNAILHGAPVRDATGNLAGGLLISLDKPLFTKFITQLPASAGYYTISQRRADKEIKWFTAGNQELSGQANTTIVAIDNDQWRIALTSLGAHDTRDNAQMIPLIAGLVTGLILAAMVIMLKHLWYEAIERNLQKLTAQFKSKRAKSAKTSYTLPGFEAAHRNINTLIETLVQKASASNAAAPTAFAQPSPALASVDSNDQGLLDMDLDLADDELFESIDSAGGISPDEPTTNSAVSAPSSAIFREYDIRGIVDQNLNEQFVTLIGQAIGTRCLRAGDQSIVVGRDGRLSSDALAKALGDGITSTGCNVIDVGMVPTPVVYYAAKNLDTQSAVMITGSHNPPNYNGFKIVIRDQTLYGEGIQELYRLIEASDFEQGAGSTQTASILGNYVKKVAADVAIGHSLKVVIDAGNGVAGPAILKLIDALGCDTVGLYCDVDGNFPNHHPDPSKPENLQALIQKVREEQADLGLALDGDGDRLGVVTPKGKIIYPDRLLMLYAKDILARNPGGEIIFDIKCTSDLHELISAMGGRPIMWKTGHSLIKAKLKETKALIAGEMSGHIFFNDRWYGFDDALYSAARLLEILSVETQDLDGLMEELPEKISTPEINIPVTEESKFEIMYALQRSGEFRGNVVTLDGIRVDYNNGWGLVRASNTTPNLVARFEADTDENLKTIQDEFRSNLLNVEPKLGLPF
jgi:phosphomannomutase/phosphoglucomutase